jgi:hypothetical protein
MSMMDWLEGRDREIADDTDYVEPEEDRDFNQDQDYLDGKTEEDRDELAHEAEWESFINGY